MRKCHTKYCFIILRCLNNTAEADHNFFSQSLVDQFWCISSVLYVSSQSPSLKQSDTFITWYSQQVSQFQSDLWIPQEYPFDSVKTFEYLNLHSFWRQPPWFHLPKELFEVGLLPSWNCSLKVSSKTEEYFLYFQWRSWEKKSVRNHCCNFILTKGQIYSCLQTSFKNKKENMYATH